MVIGKQNWSRQQTFEEWHVIPLNSAVCKSSVWCLIMVVPWLIRVYKCQRKCCYICLIYGFCLARGEGLFCKVFMLSCLLMGLKSLSVSKRSFKTCRKWTAKMCLKSSFVLCIRWRSSETQTFHTDSRTYKVSRKDISWVFCKASDTVNNSANLWAKLSAPINKGPAQMCASMDGPNVFSFPVSTGGGRLQGVQCRHLE